MTLFDRQMTAKMAHFDFHWYAKQNNLSLGNDRILSHYNEIGRHRGSSPTPYFDAGWYATIAKLADTHDIDLFDHCLLHGAQDVLDPHPLFNAKWYQWSYIGAETAIHPLTHYIETGWRRGHNPHPLFWGRWYRDEYLKDADHIDPFYHFLTEGHEAGCRPNPLFDTAWYRETYRLGRSENCLVDYIYGGHLTRDPHPYFDSDRYRRATTCEGLSPLEHYLTKGSEVSPCAAFDLGFFAAAARRHRMFDAVKDLPPLVQFIVLSKTGPIDPHPLFSGKFYLEANRNIRTAIVDPFYHYMRSGAREGRQPHPLFEPDFYWEQYPDRRDRNPLVDYLERFADTTALPRRPGRIDTTAKPLPSTRTIVNLARWRGTADRHDNALKIGVFAHIYYSDLSDYVVSHTNNIPYNCTIYISTTTFRDAALINETFTKASSHPFVIRVVPNRGRDIAPLVVAYRDILRDCDYALHIHTKKSKHYDGGFDRWRDYLFEANLGSPDLVRAIVHALAEPHVGAVAPEHFGPIKPLIQWGGNFETARTLLALCGETLAADATLDFPSGSMFWFKPKAMAKLLDLGLDTCHFDPELGQVDGTLAHAIERSFFSFVEMAGLDWVVQDAGLEPDPARPQVEGRIPGNRFLPTDRDLGLTRAYYPECTEYLVRPSPVSRPRLNLLIPLIDRNKGYAGIATALQVFTELVAALGPDFDARIIVTDVSIGGHFVPPPSFEVASALEADIAGRNTVVDASRRYTHPVFFRETDILFATAWWTASGAMSIRAQQEALFSRKPAKFLYLVQDFECGFYPWSTKYALAERTYRDPDAMIPVFNTGILAEFFHERYAIRNGHVLNPGISAGIDRHIARGTEKERIVMLYARPHAERNCLHFLDMLVRTAIDADPGFWSDWRFVAIGEDFDPGLLRCTDRIEVQGRLSLEEYGHLASRAALGVSLMLSPHPSYPPLEMANAGALVLTNTYDNKDIGELHDNITSFETFDLDAVSGMLHAMARRWLATPDIGWHGTDRAGWFFGGRTNLPSLVHALREEVRHLAAR
ncbi:hypothetical protein FF100_13910 [Methylobacterium terricola]|uniref:Rhamnan synthesis protein F n=1 Tax=Methylobacterium terricola TaxID=2583531 RepID=A0A5C4LIL3_9HYPH|nr:rhamnan synthesis F family protein [Methylobacterium terricola]TNC12754.1 hypothetical protein FF100_13910 [Methylobacterium terricola]